MLRASCIIKEGFPVIFHSIVGKDMREANSPSWFNIEEASLVKFYIEQLRLDKGLRVSESSPLEFVCHYLIVLCSR